jgi:excinuclease UvrABC ATPase subunit
MMAGVREADSHDVIEVRGARENNLKDISVDIPKQHLLASATSPSDSR